MTDIDLTRWNRAGLRRFSYVDGNAATYLEQLRLALSERFPTWGGDANHVSGQTLQAEATDPVARGERLLAQYNDLRRDWAWEIARTFARACHVLTGHVDAFANEGFIETATQWDLLRRLVEMLGYAPAPPSSATTVLAVHAKPAKVGLVARGLQVKNSPDDGSPPVVFETLADLEIAAELNELRLARWNRSEQAFDPFGGASDGTGAPWAKGEATKLSVGQLAILQQAPEPGSTVAVVKAVRAVQLAAIDGAGGQLRIAMPGLRRRGRVESYWLRGYTSLLAEPQKQLTPELNGPGLVHLDRAHGLSAGDVVAWRAASEWQFAIVDRADAEGIVVPQRGDTPRGSIYRPVRVPPCTNTKGTTPISEFRVAPNLAVAAYVDPSGAVKVLPLSSFERRAAEDEKGYLVLKPSIAISASELYAVLAGSPSIGNVRAATDTPDAYRFRGAPSGLASGDWVVAEFLGARGLEATAARVASIQEGDGSFTLTLEDPDTAAASTVDDERLRELIRKLRRVEAVLDQPIWETLRVSELFDGTVLDLPSSSIEGVGVRGASPASYSDKALRAGIDTVRDVGELAPTRQIGGISNTLLREFRTRAELLLRFADETNRLPELDSALAKNVVAFESGSATRPVARSLERLIGPFKHRLRPSDFDRNPLPIEGPPYALALNAGATPAALKAGRLVLVRKAGSSEAPLSVTVTKVEGSSIVTTPLLSAASGYTLGNTVILGNAVPTGHGEAKPERVLGSGNAATPNQEFVLDVPGVSFVSDPTMPSGVRADIVVSVNGQNFEQVASLREAGPADPAYTVRLTETGFLRIAFGDGEHGRRLPTGTNNLRVRFRVGNGLGGNVPAGSLGKLVRPHPLVARVEQRLTATGGADLEDQDSLRSSAPQSLLTLERAVALRDYADLARSQSNVWQAQAFSRSTSRGRSETVEVVIVPAGGATLDSALLPIIPDTIERQRAFLLSHAPPGIEVVVTVFEPVLFDLKVQIRVKSAEFEATKVVERVSQDLWQRFGLERRELGKPLYKSEVFDVVENVLGVENSDCQISLVAAGTMSTRPRRVVTAASDAQVIETILPRERQVIYLDRNHSTLVVEAKEYEL